MTKYVYVSNKDPQDATEFVGLPGEEPVPQGGEISLTKAEHELLSARINFEKVGGEDKTEQGDSSTKGDEDRS